MWQELEEKAEAVATALRRAKSKRQVDSAVVGSLAKLNGAVPGEIEIVAMGDDVRQLQSTLFQFDIAGESADVNGGKAVDNRKL